jgi:hypothetical protein
MTIFRVLAHPYKLKSAAVSNNTIRYLFSVFGFSPGGSGPYTCTQKANNSDIQNEKQYGSQKTQNGEQSIQNKTKIKRTIIT